MFSKTFWVINPCMFALGILSAIPGIKNSIRLGSDDFLATRGIELGFFSLICKHPARACCLADLLVCLLFNLLGCLSARRTRLLPAAVKCLTSVIASSLHLIPGRGYVNSYSDFKSRLPLRSDDLLVTFATSGDVLVALFLGSFGRFPGHPWGSCLVVLLVLFAFL